MKTITLEKLNAENWLKICDLSVSDDQKTTFSVPNVYWIGISRYEEHTELFAIKADNEYVGLIGGGYDEDGITGYINPLMIDKNYQRMGFATFAMKLMIDYLKQELTVSKINIGHRKNNVVAGNFYQKLGFVIQKDTGKECHRTLHF